MKRGRVQLKNKIIKCLNAYRIGASNSWGDWSYAVRGGIENLGSKGDSKDLLPRCVIGLRNDGKAILIYPHVHQNWIIPLEVCFLLEEYEEMGGLTGCAKSIGDAIDIASNDKRKKRTYDYRRTLERWRKRQEEKHGTTKEE